MAQATNTILGEIKLTGDLAGDGGPQVGTNPQLTKMPGVVPGTYSSPEITVDSKGRITNVTGGTGPVIIKSIPGASKSRKGIVSIGDNLYIDEHDVAGTWTVNFGKALTEEALTGLCDNSFGQYSFSVTFETTTFVIDFTGAEVQTYGQFVTLINSKISSKGMVQIVDGDLKFTSNLADRTSSVSIGTGALESMQFFLSVGTGQDGQDNCSLYAKRATAEDFGVIRVGEGLEVVDGSLNVVPADIPNATTTSKGIVQVGSGLEVTDGILSIPNATTTSKGIVQVGSGLEVTDGVVEVDIQSVAENLPNATTTSKGIVQVGSGLEVTDGVVSINTEDLPNATTTSKGIVQVGSGLEVTDGVIEVPVASEVKAGVVKIGTGLEVTDGVIEVPVASDVKAGVVKIGTGLSITNDGSLSADSQPNATTTSKGIVQVGSGLEVTDGVIEVPVASNVRAGVVKIGTGLEVTDGVMNVSVDVDSDSFPDASATIKGVASFGEGFVVDSGHVSVQQIEPYIPSQGQYSKPGIAQYNPEQFDITDGVVSIKQEVLDSIARVDLPNRFKSAFTYQAINQIADGSTQLLSTINPIRPFISITEGVEPVSEHYLNYPPVHKIIASYIGSSTIEQRIRYQTTTSTTDIYLRQIDTEPLPDFKITTVPPNSICIITLEYVNPNWKLDGPDSSNDRFTTYVKNVSIYPV